MVFKLFWCLVMENIEIKVCTCVYETLTNFEDPTETLFKTLVVAFRKPPVILKVIRTSLLQNYLNIPPSYSAYETNYIIIKRVQLLLFTITGSFLNATLNIGAHTKSTDLIIWAVEQNSHLMS